MRSIVSVVAFCFLLFCSSAFAQAEASAEKMADIKKLLEVSGIKDQMGYMKESLLNSVGSMIAGSYPKVPDAFWDDFNSLISQKDLDHLIDQVVPVYDKHMSHEAVKQLITMFETPFWDEWKKKMPLISREAGLIGSEWGQKLVQAESFNKRVDALVIKHELEKLNSIPKKK
jgi:hypothetical protein